MHFSIFIIGNAVLSVAVVLSHSLEQANSQVAQVKNDHENLTPAMVVTQVFEYENHPQMKTSTFMWTYPLGNDTTSTQTLPKDEEADKIINNDDKALEERYMHTKNEPPECYDDDDDEQEYLDCDECGGAQWDDVARFKRCKGIPEKNYQWKDCFCRPRLMEPMPYCAPDSPTAAEIREVLSNLPLWTDASYATGPPPASPPKGEGDARRDINDEEEKKNESNDEKSSK